MDFKKKIILAPMAGVSDSVFRRICRGFGADIVVSEMVSAEGLFHNSKNTAELLTFSPEERPIGIQLFGASPDHLARAASYVEETVHPDFIDLNSGCPVRKVVQRNGGAALLKDKKLFEDIITAMVKAARQTPITVKIRSAWHHGDWVDVEYARIAEQCGAAAIALHPRSKTMGFTGQAMWERIGLVKQAVQIPVIGNGDIVNPLDAKQMMEQTGCDSIMIGRGAMGNPWLLAQCRSVLDGKPPQRVTRQDRFSFVVKHLDLFIEMRGEESAFHEMKKHCAWYLKGLPGAGTVRNNLFRATSTQEMKNALERFFNFNGELKDIGD